MSQENVDWLRQVFEAWIEDNRQKTEAMLREGLGSDFEMHPLYLDKMYRGVEGIWAMWADAREIWEDYRFDLEEILDRGDHALVTGRIMGRGATSGVPINQPLAILFTFRDDKAVRARSFTSKQDALEGSGLSE